MMSNANVFWNNADFLPQFKAIGQSMKRRFFRKPNVADAINQYESLCADLQREDQKEFAAMCCLESAKCHETLQSPIQQANSLVKAATLLLQARETSKCFESDRTGDKPKFGRTAEAQKQLALQCLQQAAELFLGQKHFGLNVLLTMQVAQMLYATKSYGDALKYYRKAYDVAKENFTFSDELVILEYVIKCKVKLGEYESSSKSVQETLVALNQRKEEVPPVFWVQYAIRFEITRVCLVLIVGTNTTDLFQFLWPETLQSGNAIQNERLAVQVKLKSLVLAYQQGCTSEVISVKSGLSQYLTGVHHELFQSLLQMQL